MAKFYFIVDRIDLMEQATDEFAARGLVVHNAKSRKELMDDIANREVTDNDEGKPEIMVVNIQKFKEDKTKVMVDDSYSTTSLMKHTEGITHKAASWQTFWKQTKAQSKSH